MTILSRFVKVYVVKVNPLKCPQACGTHLLFLSSKVIGSLIDLDCSEDFIKTLLQNVRAACPAEPLVEQIEKRNRLRLILPWLEARVAEGNQDRGWLKAVKYKDLSLPVHIYIICLSSSKGSASAQCHGKDLD